MGKYTSFGEFLRQQKAAEVCLTFEEIEKIIGAKLPPSSKQYRAWWSNNPHNSVLTQVWLDAGFQSEDVDMKLRRLVFRRVTREVRGRDDADRGDRVTLASPAAKRHPLIGALKGMIRIAPGTDLTQPADPEWGDRVWGDKT
jgi:hypothetical protein